MFPPSVAPEPHVRTNLHYRFEKACISGGELSFFQFCRIHFAQFKEQLVVTTAPFGEVSKNDRYVVPPGIAFGSLDKSGGTIEEHGPVGIVGMRRRLVGNEPEDV